MADYAAAYGQPPPAYGYAAPPAYGYTAPPPDYGVQPVYGAPPPAYSVAPVQGYTPPPGYALVAAPGYASSGPVHPSYGSHSPAPVYAGYAPAPGYPPPGGVVDLTASATSPHGAAMGYGPVGFAGGGRPDRSKRGRDDQGQGDSKRARKGNGESKGKGKGDRRDKDQGDGKGSRKNKGESKGKGGPGEKTKAKKGTGAAKGGDKVATEDTNVYVHGIPTAWKQDDLKGHFAKFGAIESVKIATDSAGASKGYGFVRFGCQNHAHKAIKSTNGTTIGEQKLIVKMKQKEARAGEADSKGAVDKPGPGTGKKGPAGSTAYIYHVPHDWSDKDLEMCFQHCGTIASVKIGKGPDGKSKGYSFIDFESGPISVMKAIVAMDNYNASPLCRLKVNPKQGEEDLVPAIPKLEFPPPSCPFEGPAHWRKSEPGSTIFVFYLPRDWTDIELFLTFVHLGDITACKIQTKVGDDLEQESRGFGYVTFASKLSAARAIKAFNGFNTGGKSRLQVAIRKGEEEHVESILKDMSAIPDWICPPGQKRAYEEDTQEKLRQKQEAEDARKVTPDANVFVHHLPPSWKEDELRKEFDKYGTILSVKVVRNEDGESRCFGFVGFQNAECAQRAIKVHDGKTVEGKTLIVKIKDEGREKKDEAKKDEAKK